MINMPREVVLERKIKILPEGCAIINDDTMVISDLHLGYEGVMATSGLFMPRVSLQDITDKIENVLKRENNVSKLIINGDLKHEFAELHRFEWKDVDDFVRYAKERFSELIVVRGNHDNYLKVLLKKYGIEMYESHYETDEFLITHGDRMIINAFSKRYLIIGHEHPAMVIKDSVNVKVKVPCFLYGRVEGVNLLVLPAFSPIFPGTDMLSVPPSALLSPILRKTGIDDLKIYACVEDEILEFPKVGVVKRHG